ncbi:hypothetical protein MmTuc01_1515 [Methanosarcina mazei Tuc01]|uniref:Uncharacterized protein n=1 Tax=Methanosarcina mazei Tuc01 TaxID=1236903 RepID=M1PXA0_METMZ|nr:hypothetical protein MmTuc01_1515 [Methanosarcina mazei Tuc01]
MIKRSIFWRDLNYTDLDFENSFLTQTWVLKTLLSLSCQV